MTHANSRCIPLCALAASTWLCSGECALGNPPLLAGVQLRRILANNRREEKQRFEYERQAAGGRNVAGTAECARVC